MIGMLLAPITNVHNSLFRILMTWTRRDFLKTTGLACGTVLLPAWVLETEAPEAASVDKNGLADIAIGQAKRAGAT
jgi:hypothetical protein